MGGEHMKDNFLYLRIPTEIKEKVRKAAEIEHRSMSSEVVHLIEKGIKELMDKQEEASA
jgi:uncharacterized protein (DUF1778 family)